MPRPKKVLTAADLLTEREFTIQVCHMAHAMGWKVTHNSDVRRDSSFTTPGAPDLWLVRPPRLVTAELKTMKGKPSSEQLEWLEDVRASGGEGYLWRPSDWKTIEEILGPQRFRLWR